MIVQCNKDLDFLEADSEKNKSALKQPFVVKK